jgi:hypothetical protein
MQWVAEAPSLLRAQEPCRTYVLRDVICAYCNVCADLDLCRDPSLQARC